MNLLQRTLKIAALGILQRARQEGTRITYTELVKAIGESLPGTPSEKLASALEIVDELEEQRQIHVDASEVVATRNPEIYISLR